MFKMKEKTNEWNLSERMFKDETIDKNDVKEFIRRLKEEMEMCLIDYTLDWNEVDNVIDRLAGEKLK